jgi:hypothetical protein
VSQLWNRVGVFRPLAVAVLVMSVVGSVELTTGRQSQQYSTKSESNAQSERDETNQLRVDRTERERASVVSRAAQREAQQKADAAAVAAAVQAKAVEDAAKKPPPTTPSGGGPAAPPNYGPIPASCSAYTGNRGVGCAVLLQTGFGLDQMPCLDKLFNRESGWRTNAQNPSGAYGIPQALPGSKMATVGADWQTNPATQITWGLGYIKSRYSTPCGAWSHSEATGWY